MNRRAYSRRWRSVGQLLILGLVAWALAGCGSSGSQASVEPPVRVPEPTEVVETTGTFEAERTYTGDIDNPDGSTGGVVMEVGKRYDPGDSAFPSEFASAASTCTVDSERDVLIPVRITVTSSTERFASEFKSGVVVLGIPGLPDAGDPTIEIGSDFTDGAECEGEQYRRVTSGVDFGEMAEDESKTHDFVVVVHDFYSPNSPDGNESAISELDLAPVSNSQPVSCVESNETNDWAQPKLMGDDEEQLNCG